MQREGEKAGGIQEGFTGIGGIHADGIGDAAGMLACEIAPAGIQQCCDQLAAQLGGDAGFGIGRIAEREEHQHGFYDERACDQQHQRADGRGKPNPAESSGKGIIDAVAASPRLAANQPQRRHQRTKAQGFGKAGQHKADEQDD